MKIGNQEFDTQKHTYVMGILNVTPDSFSDGGEHKEIDAALFHVAKMIEEGADIIDVGGESTRPGFIGVSAAEECERVLPVVENIKSRFNIPVSVDTSKSVVAYESILAGADMINDVWGLMKDPNMGEIISAADVACVLMHNREMHNNENASYVNFESDFFEDISGILVRAQKAGIKDEKIILDPGIGFAKTDAQNRYVLANSGRLRLLGYPWLLGASRKSVIGNALNLPVNERLEGTLALTALAVINKASFVRVHDVKENVRVIKMLEAVYGQDNC